MIQVNIKAVGMVGIYRYSDEREVRKFEKEDILKKLEKLEFTNKEIQQELRDFKGHLLMVRTIGLGSRKDNRVDLYMQPTSFGRKRPEISILGNYPLYNMLKEFIE